MSFVEDQYTDSAPAWHYPRGGVNLPGNSNCSMEDEVPASSGTIAIGQGGMGSD